ncbi:MAG: endonuclease III, partial [Pseudomonadota bacterium]
HGRYVCKARTPECWRCTIAELCRYKPKTPDPATVSKLGPKKRARR